MQACRGLLSQDERQRAVRFRFPEHQRRFTVARATLRQALAGFLGLPDPASLTFDYGPHGKPVLSAGSTQLSFNASHTGDRLLIGVREGGDIGVDIERHRPLVDRDGLVRRYFSPAENEAYFRLPKDVREDAFFACWTRKEAFVKALGRGLSFPLKDFDVGFAAGENGLLFLQGEPDARSRWHLEGIEAEVGYSAAFATQGRFCRLEALNQCDAGLNSP